MVYFRRAHIVLSLMALWSRCLDIPADFEEEGGEEQREKPGFKEGFRRDYSSRKALVHPEYANLSWREQEELHECFGGDTTLFDERPALQEDRYSSITPAKFQIPAYWYLLGHLHETDNALVVGYGSGVMMGYFWAEMRNAPNPNSHIYGFEFRATKEPITRRNLAKNGTFMTGDLAYRKCRPLPVPEERYTLVNRDFFEDVNAGVNEVGFDGKSVAAANGPYDVIYVGCAIDGFKNGLDIVLKMLDPVGGLVMPFQVWDDIQGFVYFSPRGNCRLLGYSRVKPCESEFTHTMPDDGRLLKYYSDMTSVCEFLQRYYQEFIYYNRLGEIKKRYAEGCWDCGRTFEEHSDDYWDALGYQWQAVPGQKRHNKRHLEERRVRREMEEQWRKWDESGRQEAAEEEEMKQRRFRWPKLDMNIPDEKWLRDWVDPNISLPRINKKGVGIVEAWSPPSGYESSSYADTEEIGTWVERHNSSPNAIPLPDIFRGTQWYEMEADPNAFRHSLNMTEEEFQNFKMSDINNMTDAFRDAEYPPNGTGPDLTPYWHYEV